MDATTTYGPLDVIPPREFETSRLRLRALREDDAKLLFDLYSSDPATGRYMSFKASSRVEETESFVKPAARYFAGQPSAIHQFVWVIVLKDSGESIGTTGIGPKNDFTLSGGYILNPKWWEKGYATEAWQCVMDWAKRQPRVYRIEAAHHPDNPASGKVMKKAGMSYEGVLRRHAVFPNISPEPGDEVIYAWVRA